MASPNARKTESARAVDEDDPVEAAFRDAPLDAMPETCDERAMMAAARAEPNAWVSNEQHQTTLAERIRRER
jgi:hypothetical protein